MAAALCRAAPPPAAALAARTGRAGPPPTSRPARGFARRRAPSRLAPVSASQETERERDLWDLPAVPSLPPMRVPPPMRGPPPPMPLPPPPMGDPSAAGGGYAGGPGGPGARPPGGFAASATGPGAGAVAAGVKLRRTAAVLAALALAAAVYTRAPGVDPIRDFIDDAYEAQQVQYTELPGGQFLVNDRTWGLSLQGRETGISVAPDGTVTQDVRNSRGEVVEIREAGNIYAEEADRIVGAGGGAMDEATGERVVEFDPAEVWNPSVLREQLREVQTAIAREKYMQERGR